MRSGFDVGGFPRGIFAGSAAHLQQTVRIDGGIALHQCPYLGIEYYVGGNDPKAVLFGFAEHFSQLLSC